MRFDIFSQNKNFEMSLSNNNFVLINKFINFKISKSLRNFNFDLKINEL